MISQKKALDKINKAIELHEKMKKSYFWSSPGSAAARRSYEEYNSYKEVFSFKKDGKVYDVCINCVTTCSCSNIYYSGNFSINNKTCNISGIKKLAKLLN